MGAQQAKETRVGSGKEKHGHRAKPAASATTTAAKVDAVRSGHQVNIFTEHNGKYALRCIFHIGPNAHALKREETSVGRRSRLLKRTASKRKDSFDCLCSFLQGH